VSVRRIVSAIIYLVSGAIGLLAFIYPFLQGAGPAGPAGLARGPSPFLVTTALVGLSLIALLVDLQGQTVSAKTVALLGVLVAVASVLRFAEVAIPMPGGFSPIFVPIILVGYTFGARFGFLMGALTLLVSGLITGGVGPWLPYQMFAAGWVGLTAGWLSRLVRGAPRLDRPSRRDVFVLCAFGFVWGLLYGAIMNVTFWPFAGGTAEQSWTPGIGLGDTLTRYAAFYMVTSLGWDLMRAVGNAVLILVLGAPTVRAFARFRRRFHFEAETRA
jgi:energy-coupling factor transport system substrate-specific component